MHVDWLRWTLPGSIAAVMVAVCGLALIKGGRAERIGAALIFGFWLFQGTLQALSKAPLASLSLISVPILVGDFALATGFLVLSLRYASLWLGTAMLAQGAQLAAHAVFIASGGHHHDTFALRSNLCSALLLLALLAGTLTAWRRQVRDKRRDRAETLSGAPQPAH